MKFFHPKHTLKSVLETLIDGLENKTIVPEYIYGLSELEEYTEAKSDELDEWFSKGLFYEIGIHEDGTNLFNLNTIERVNFIKKKVESI